MISGEKASADYIGATTFVEDLSEIIRKENLTLQQIYNADETGLFWRLMPKRTLAHHEEKCPDGLKSNKERLTIMTCSNAAGSHKCKLLVIGKSAHPRAFRYSPLNLPVIYKSNKRAWMTQTIFLEWFHDHFIVEAREHCKSVGLDDDCKILLLLDNCPAHPDVSTIKSSCQIQDRMNNIIIQYIPPNCTSLIQPMDQGIIRSLKCHYRKEFMRRLSNSAYDIMTFQKDFNIKNAIWCIFRAWEAVSQSVLRNTWSNILATEDEENTPIDCDDEKELWELAKATDENLEHREISSWLNCDIDAPTAALLTEEEIIGMVNSNNAQDKNSTDSAESDIECMENPVSLTEALTACNTLITFLENTEIDGVSVQDKVQLNRIQFALSSQKENTLKQKTITDYFSDKKD